MSSLHQVCISRLLHQTVSAQGCADTGCGGERLPRGQAPLMDAPAVYGGGAHDSGSRSPVLLLAIRFCRAESSSVSACMDGRPPERNEWGR